MPNHQLPPTSPIQPRPCPGYRAVITGLVLALCVSPPLAFPPAPFTTIHGMVRDEYGKTLQLDGASVAFSKDGQQVLRMPIQASSLLNQNYQIRLRMDMQRAGTIKYNDLAQNPGQQFTLAVRINEILYQPLEMSTPPAVGKTYSLEASTDLKTWVQVSHTTRNPEPPADDASFIPPVSQIGYNATDTHAVEIFRACATAAKPSTAYTSDENFISHNFPRPASHRPVRLSGLLRRGLRHQYGPDLTTPAAARGVVAHQRGEFPRLPGTTTTRPFPLRMIVHVDANGLARLHPVQ